MGGEEAQQGPHSIDKVDNHKSLKMKIPTGSEMFKNWLSEQKLFL